MLQVMRWYHFTGDEVVLPGQEGGLPGVPLGWLSGTCNIYNKMESVLCFKKQTNTEHFSLKLILLMLLQGNENNFLSLEQCRAACQVSADKPRPPHLSFPLPRPLQLPAALPGPAPDPASCTLPPDSGSVTGNGNPANHTWAPLRNFSRVTASSGKGCPLE